MRPSLRHRLLSCLFAPVLLLGAWAAQAQTPTGQAENFELVALGVAGGLEDGNLSSYLVRARGDAHYLGLDAGTVLPGIARALDKGAFADLPPGQDATPQGQVFREAIAGYFISHAHLDHVEGLLIAATDDTGHKPIYGLASTLDSLSRDYFNWTAWPNFADRGAAPALGRYRLTETVPGQWFQIPGTALSASVYPLSHDKLTSSMVLLRTGQAYYAYFGDTGPDALSGGQHRLADIWQVLAPLVRAHRLKGLQIEVSLPNDVADAQLFGHLTPAWLLKELDALATTTGGRQPLAGLPVVVGHIKPSLVAGRDPRSLIRQQLADGSRLGVRFLFPEQGDTVLLP
ncbi:3',5'-cyclic-nucleotide phosphodiesterase [Pseudoxanthomonas sp. GM95]|uniref:MBL fold metallo-hydrolase n=1 Tax=Pseudoxanthomonas sp. GM95 TaxID=1881043 RepID=UPI0008B44226|nr:3',5'-cyclic-nucleotide phosphodiesterase [Pseudoxanthomonas sp. GM95]SEK54489.1 3',5'-cyclic-nucleotide phosphodiesterase [Pseudoxanthomonas sp. GM95]